MSERQTWVCQCGDYYDSPSKFDLYLEEPGSNQCHRWNCRWEPTEYALALEDWSAELVALYRARPKRP